MQINSQGFKLTKCVKVQNTVYQIDNCAATENISDLMIRNACMAKKMVLQLMLVRDGYIHIFCIFTNLVDV